MRPETLISTSTRYLRTRLPIDPDPKPWGIGRRDLAIPAARQEVGRELPRDRLGGEGIFADSVIRKSRIGLERSAQGQVRRESVIDVGDAARDRVVGDRFRRPDAADAAAIDLDEADAAIVDEVPRHEDVVRRPPRRRS